MALGKLTLLIANYTKNGQLQLAVFYSLLVYERLE